MKRILQVVGVGVALLVGFVIVLFLGGLALPKDIAIHVEEEVDADPAAIYPLLTHPAGLSTWWRTVAEEVGHDPMEVRVLEEEPLSVGFYPADSDSLMEQWTVLQTEPDQTVIYEVDFQVFVVERTVSLEPTEEGTHLTWTETGEIGNPLLRWMTVLMGQDSVEANIRDALQGLETVARGP